MNSIRRILKPAQIKYLFSNTKCNYLITGSVHNIKPSYLYINRNLQTVLNSKINRFAAKMWFCNMCTKAMPPVKGGKIAEIDDFIKENKVSLFSKTTCGFCQKVKSLFNELGVEIKIVELNEIGDGVELQNALFEKTGQKTVPNVFINGKHIGGCSDVLKLHSDGKLLSLVNTATADTKHDLDSYDYDLVIIGGGSGGLAASKEAASFGAKVAVLDFVKPSPQGTSWGLGGTCVNVGCIPKKLMHQASIHGHNIEDSRKFGWKFDDKVTHDWSTLRDNVQDHIGSLNWGYKVALRNKDINYINSYGEFVGPHKIKCTNRKGVVTEITAKYFIVATGCRPKLPTIPGAVEYGISSDDLFQLPKSPGKTLVVGASYVSLECAGFLKTLGFDVTVMVRSILLRGFDQQMAELIGDHMISKGINFIRPCTPSKVEKMEDGKLKVTSKMVDNDKEVVETYDTVMFAVGRSPCTNIGLDAVGVKLNTNSGFILGDEYERTSCPYVFAIGDVLDGRPELTPVAIQAGKLLARRLFASSESKMDYDTIPTTVFTPMEYGAIGISEEDAISKHGADSLDIFHTNFDPLEWTVPHRDDNKSYAKLICLKKKNNQVIGFHILSPNAGEITQGFAVAMKLGATKQDFDNCIGIHPTCAEIMTTLKITKSSGEDVSASGC